MTEEASTAPSPEDKIQGARTITGDFLAVLGGRSVSVATAPLMVILTTAILGAAGYGRLNLLLIVPSIAVQIAAQWSSAAPLVLGREELEQHGTLGRTTWARFALITPLLAIGVTVILAGRPLFGLYEGFGWGLIALALAQAPLMILGEHVVALLQAAGRMKASAVAETVQRLVVVLGVAGILVAGAGGLTLVLAALTASAGAGALYATQRIGWLGFRPLVVDRPAVWRSRCRWW